MVTVGEVGVRFKAEVVAPTQALVAGHHSVVGQALGIVESVLNSKATSTEREREREIRERGREGEREREIRERGREGEREREREGEREREQQQTSYHNNKQ